MTAQFLRPQEWIDRNNLEVGKSLDLKFTEIEVDGSGLVESISEAPPIDSGDGEVVTARFVTDLATNLVSVKFEVGTELSGTDNHPNRSLVGNESVAVDSPNDQVAEQRHVQAEHGICRHSVACDHYRQTPRTEDRGYRMSWLRGCEFISRTALAAVLDTTILCKNRS